MQPLTGLPERLLPTSIDEAHAIQDAVSARLGKLIAAHVIARPSEAPMVFRNRRREACRAASAPKAG